MSKVNFNNQELALMNNSFIVPKYINAPFTTIQNRSQVLDSSNMLQAVMGVERVPFRGINLLQKEFGANGEQVYELESKDARVRFVGSWYKADDGSGNKIVSGSNLIDYVEFTFYGTGLNLLMLYVATNRNAVFSVDGGVESANIFLTTLSPVLGSRNYGMNVVVPIVSGLSLGWHTVKLRNNTASNDTTLFGLEILNQSTSLTIPAGQAFIGNKKESLAVLSTSAYNAGFTGTKGGRVSKYLLNGAISQVIRECAATPSYLTSTDHTNEEVVRRINFREFGANRGDDFSTLSTARTAAFTLDDGTTTLVTSGSQVVLPDSLLMDNTFFTTLTFVGTGLDIYRSSIGGTCEIIVNGVFIGYFGGSEKNYVKICSGLPYGTHTVKFSRVANTANYTYLTDFIIYQPKKPSIPSGAIEIADYNVMADFVANTTSTVDNIATGVLRKFCTREFTYTGSAAWVVNTLTPTAFAGGFEILQNTGAIGNRVTYTFFGTGFDWRQLANSTPGSVQFALNGVNLTSANFPTASLASYGFTNAYPTSTGIQNEVSASQTFAGVRCSLLPLGFYTLTVTTTTADQMRVSAIDIITPIHINHPTLKIGSLGLLDNDKIQALTLPVSGPDLSKAKAWVVFDQANSKILGSFNISQCLSAGTGATFVYFNKPFKNNNYAITAASRNFETRANVSGPNYCQIILSNSAGAVVNDTFYIAVFGELLDE